MQISKPNPQDSDSVAWVGVILADWCKLYLEDLKLVAKYSHEVGDQQLTLT